MHPGLAHALAQESNDGPKHALVDMSQIELKAEDLVRRPIA